MLEYFDNIGILMGGWAAIGTSCILAGALPTPRRRGLMVRKLSKLVSSGAMEQDRARPYRRSSPAGTPCVLYVTARRPSMLLIDALKESDIAPGADLASAAEETKALQLRTLKAISVGVTASLATRSEMTASRSLQSSPNGRGSLRGRMAAYQQSGSTRRALIRRGSMNRSPHFPSSCKAVSSSSSPLDRPTFRVCGA